MCKLILAVKKEGENPTLRNLLEAQRDELATQKDGLAIFLATPDGKFAVSRSLYDYDTHFDNLMRLLPRATLIGIHTRIRSSGEVDEANLHFFNSAGYYFAHNGFVNKYHTTPTYHYPNSIGFDSRDEGFTGTEFVEDKDGILLPKTSVSTKPKGLEEFEFISDIITDCFQCALYCELCPKHEELPKWLIDDSDSFFEYISAEKTANGGSTPEAMKSCKAYLSQGKGEQKLLIEAKKDRRKEKKEAKKKKKEAAAMCDSFQFLEALTKPVSLESLEKAVVADDFTGMGVLINTNGGIEPTLIVKKACYSITDKKSFAAFFSYEPEKEVDNYEVENVFGVDVVKNDEKVEIKLPSKSIYEGIYKLDYQKLCSPSLKT